MTTEYDEAEALAWFVTLCDGLGVPLDSDLDLLCAVYGPLLDTLNKPVFGLHLFRDRMRLDGVKRVRLGDMNSPDNWYFDYTGLWEASHG